MRATIFLILSLLLAGCGSSGRSPVAAGPRLKASLAAVWPTAGPARQSTFSRDGRMVALADASGAITIRNTTNWTIVGQLQHPGGATSLAFSADGTRLFSGGYDGTVHEWDLKRQALVRTLKGPVGTVWTIDLSPDGKRLAAAGEDQVIRIWNLDRPSSPAELRGHERNIWEIRFSPDGKRLASGSFDATVRLWDVESGKLLETLTGHTEAVVGVDFSPDGRILATGADDSTIRLWRTSDGAPLRTIANGTHIDKVAFSPDGRWLASGGHPHGSTGEIWHQLTGGGGNGPAVRIWRTSDAALVAELPHPEDVIFVAFSRDGRWLVTSGEDNRFRLWKLDPVF